jgi:hypothetical protein
MVAIAALRRVQNVIQFVPLVGDVIDLIPIPFHFDAHANGAIVGGVTRIWGFRDRYRVELPATIDRRLAYALGVALDALQSR